MSDHAHKFDGRWPFTEAENTAVFACDHVIHGGRAILRVSHDEEGDWQFHCGDSHADSAPLIICMGCIIERDPTLASVADLPSGWGADRETIGGEWSKEENPRSIDDESDDA
jgi:hypothetical protein